MNHCLPIAIAVLALGGCGQSPRCATSDAEGLVEALKPEKQFESMLTMTVERTQTARMAVARDDPEAKRKLAQSIDEAVERHKAEWKSNLVASWQILGGAEIEQACAALGERDENTFNRFTQKVGPVVQSRNEPLLKSAAAEVLQEIW